MENLRPGALAIKLHELANRIRHELTDRLAPARRRRVASLLVQVDKVAGELAKAAQIEMFPNPAADRAEADRARGGPVAGAPMFVRAAQAASDASKDTGCFTPGCKHGLHAVGCALTTRSPAGEE